MKTTIPLVRNSIHDLLFVPLLFVCLAVSSVAQAGSPTNTSLGLQSLPGNTTGLDNTAIGYQALMNNTTAHSNTAVGSVALLANTAGINNTAIGAAALHRNTTGRRNTAIGYHALVDNTTGSFNIALGSFAGEDLFTGSHNIYIGSDAPATESNTIRIGDFNQTRTFIAGISGTAVTGAAVVVNAQGQLGTAPSSQRFKEGIKPMDKTSEVLFTLKPVAFHYKKELDPEGIPQFGLVAEEVEKVNPDLVVRDRAGKPYSVRYDQVNAMLLNEFLKEHKKVEEQERKLEQQEAIIGKQQKQIEALTVGFQKVSAQVEMNRPSPQTVLNNQ